MLDFFIAAVFYLIISLPFLLILAYVLRGIAGLINLFAKLMFFLGDVARWFGRKIDSDDGETDTDSATHSHTPSETGGVTEEGAEPAADKEIEAFIVEAEEAEELEEIPGAADSTSVNKR